MKKIFIAGFVTLIISLGLSLVNHAQFTKFKQDDPSQNQPEKIISLPLNFKTPEILRAANYNEISSKVVRNFLRSFGNLSDVKWYKTDEGLAAYFTEDSIKTRVFYSISGNYQSMLRQYYENKLNKEIRYLIKNKYDGFSIYYVNEINADGITIYFVKIENKTSWKTIRIVDTEMEIIETVLKENASQQDNNKL